MYVAWLKPGQHPDPDDPLTWIAIRVGPGSNPDLKKAWAYNEAYILGIVVRYYSRLLTRANGKCVFAG